MLNPGGGNAGESCAGGASRCRRMSARLYFTGTLEAGAVYAWGSHTLRRPRYSVLASLLGTVPMDHLDPISGLAHGLADVFGNHHRAMLPPGTAKADGEIALAFMNVVG